MWRIPGIVALVLGVVLAWPAVAAAVGPPDVPASWVEDVSPTGALLKAEVNPNGLATSYRFEYLTEAAYIASGGTFAGAATTPAAGVGSGSSTVTVFKTLGGLAPATAYRYRPVATSTAVGGGATIGPEHVLITEATAISPRPPDGRGWELVSPPDKEGGAIAAPESLFGGGDLQAAADGDSIAYSAASSFGGAAGAPGASQYLSARGGSGWSTRNITAPALSGSYGDQPDGVPYRLFSGDLARALMLNGSRCEEGEACPRGYSLRNGAGALLSSSPEAPGLAFAGASPDLLHVVFSSPASLYAWSAGGGLAAIGAGPGATLAAPVDAVSSDGSRVYFTERGHLYLREGVATHQIDEAVGGGGTFQTATPDGSVAFFTKAGHLYRHLAAGATTDLTPGGGVVGVLGASAAGDVVYYQDGAGLQRWRSGEGTTAIALGSEVVSPSDYPPAAATARVSADGLHLAFLSAASIPPFDNTDANTKQPDTELYLYGPPPGGGPARLLCASCNPTGERPSASARVPGALVNGSTAVYRPRFLSASGNRVFFDTADRLVIADTDSRPDVYEWEAEGEGDCTHSPGCVGLISGGRVAGGRFVDASSDGRDVFFVTEDSLLGADPGSIDLYDARAGGGFPEPEAPIACLGDACQALPSPPEDPAPGTLVKNSGNPPLKYYGAQKRKRCKKGQVKRHGKCVQKKRPRGSR